jgi:predicted lipoprotein with Yx(FWY)xxD motif
MRRRLGWGVVPLVAIAVAAAVAATAAAATKPATVKIVQTSGYGKLLATSGGLTLYHYTDEKPGKIDCKGGCAKLWPPLLVKAGAKPIAGAGANAAKLGTIRRPDGGLQVTYNRLALYRYAPDRKAGDVRGEGVEHAWYAISPVGKIVTRMASPASSSPSTPSGSETTPGSGYGDGYG